MHQSTCGWCGATNNCIAGNTIGPMETCVKSSYIYASPYNPNQITHVINDNVGGVSLTVISK